MCASTFFLLPLSSSFSDTLSSLKSSLTIKLRDANLTIQNLKKSSKYILIRIILKMLKANYC